AVDKVTGQPQAEGLNGVDTVPGEGVHRVLLRVGRQYVRVVAGEMGVGEVSREGDADVEIDEVVPVLGTSQPYQAHLGLSVVVRTEHVSSPGRASIGTGSAAVARGDAAPAVPRRRQLIPRGRTQIGPRCRRSDGTYRHATRHRAPSRGAGHRRR